MPVPPPASNHLDLTLIHFPSLQWPPPAARPAMRSASALGSSSSARRDSPGAVDPGPGPGQYEGAPPFTAGTPGGRFNMSNVRGTSSAGAPGGRRSGPARAAPGARRNCRCDGATRLSHGPPLWPFRGAAQVGHCVDGAEGGAGGIGPRGRVVWAVLAHPFPARSCRGPVCTTRRRCRCPRAAASTSRDPSPS